MGDLLFTRVLLFEIVSKHEKNELAIMFLL